MISAEQALEQILASAHPLQTEAVGLTDLAGRVLAKDIAATRDQPPLSVSAMDGYAVIGHEISQLPKEVKVVGEAAAGAGYGTSLRPGEAVRIFTGAPLPAGADTVVIQEDVDALEGGMISVREGGPTGRHVRAAGIDFRAGDKVFTAGKRLSARDVGLLAALNQPEAQVFRRPRVALLSTGDELVPPGTEPGPSQIINSNAYALAALCRAEGAEIIELGIVGDTPQALQDTLDNAPGFDVLVTIGGASVGDYDLVKSALGDRGLDLNFWKVAIRPGKPLIFGHLDDRLMLGLPGNPVSSYVCAVLFLLPLIRRLQGIVDAAPKLEAALAAADLPENGSRQDYMRAKIAGFGNSGLPLLQPFDSQDSSLMSVLARADALLVRAPHAPALTAGAPVEMIRL